MRNILSIICLFIFCTSCASVHSGSYAVPVNQVNSDTTKKTSIEEGLQAESELIISGKLKRQLSSKFFAFIDLTFENTSQEWVRLTDIKIDFGSEEANENINFTYGTDLSVWFKSTQKRNKIRNYNQQLAIGVITGLGAGIAAGSNNSNIQSLGLMTATAGATVLSVNEFNKIQSKIEDAEIFPENHLFAKDFIIPPGLFDKKWLVINSKNHGKIGFITDLYLEYRINDIEKEKVKLQFRSLNTKSQPVWQSDIDRSNIATKPFQRHQ